MHAPLEAENKEQVTGWAVLANQVCLLQGRFSTQPTNPRFRGSQKAQKAQIGKFSLGPLRVVVQAAAGLTAWLGRVGLLPLKASIEAWAQARFDFATLTKLD